MGNKSNVWGLFSPVLSSIVFVRTWSRDFLIFQEESVGFGHIRSQLCRTAIHNRAFFIGPRAKIGPNRLFGFLEPRWGVLESNEIWVDDVLSEVVTGSTSIRKHLGNSKMILEVFIVDVHWFGVKSVSLLSALEHVMSDGSFLLLLNNIVGSRSGSLFLLVFKPPFSLSKCSNMAPHLSTKAV